MGRTEEGRNLLSQIQDCGWHCAAFFSWEIEPILFFLAEKEKNGFKKAFLWVRRKPEEAGGQSRPPLRVRWEIGDCTDVLQLLPDPHPSASQTPSPEGKAIRCGGDRADRVVRPYGCGRRSEERADRVVRPYGCGGKS